VSRRGETTLRDGDAMLLSYSVGRTITRPALVDHRVIRLSRTSLRLLVHHIDDAVLRPIPRGTAMLNLLRGCADALFDDPVLSASDLRQLLVTHLCDLVAVTLGATRDAAATAEGRGVRAARLREIKTDIEANLAHGDLSPAAVARRQKVSESYIRKLFEGEETSFSVFVLTRRLLRAHRLLLDPRGALQTISSIAFEAGFSDLSYFNRAFKRFYGATPSEIRSLTRCTAGTWKTRQRPQ
jgi:AraC-like DNA-binding protein